MNAIIGKIMKNNRSVFINEEETIDVLFERIRADIVIFNKPKTREIDPKKSPLLVIELKKKYE